MDRRIVRVQCEGTCGEYSKTYTQLSTGRYFTKVHSLSTRLRGPLLFLPSLQLASSFRNASFGTLRSLPTACRSAPIR